LADLPAWHLRRNSEHLATRRATPPELHATSGRPVLTHLDHPRSSVSGPAACGLASGTAGEGQRLSDLQEAFEAGKDHRPTRFDDFEECALGGTLTAGPAEGGFTVEAVIPTTALPAKDGSTAHAVPLTATPRRWVSPS
jgi:hypothetical protein